MVARPDYVLADAMKPRMRCVRSLRIAVVVGHSVGLAEVARVGVALDGETEASADGHMVSVRILGVGRRSGEVVSATDWLANFPEDKQLRLAGEDSQAAKGTQPSGLGEDVVGKENVVRCSSEAGHQLASLWLVR
jgi:hypothetical protein